MADPEQQRPVDGFKMIKPTVLNRVLEKQLSKHIETIL